MPTAKENAELFGLAYMRGRKGGLKEAKRLIRSAAYARKRIAFLARWRKYAIDRLGLGPQLVEEIDKKARAGKT
jgi:hypothetical protein